MNLVDFKTQYRDILKIKLENRLNKLKESNAKSYRIEDIEEQLGRLNDIENIKFGNMDFWGTSTSSDKLIVSIITNNIKLYKESIRFEKVETIMRDIKMFNYTKFIIENDALVDFYRVENSNKAQYAVDSTDIIINVDNIHKSYQDSLPIGISYYKSKHTRSGANMGYWNIGGTRVYD